MTSPTLDYERPTDRAPLPNPLYAVLLCLPGLICWSLLLGVIFGIEGMFLGVGEFILPLWTIAVITAVASVVCYWKQRKPWYVRLNLAINVAGLVFTGIIFSAAL